MLAGIYARGLMLGALLGAASIAAPHIEGAVPIVTTVVAAAALVAVIVADIRQLNCEQRELEDLAARRVRSTETREDDDVWGNEA